VHNAHVGAHWTTSLLFSLIQELVDYYDPSKDHFNGAVHSILTYHRCTDKGNRVAADDAAKVIEKYNRFAERVDELGLQGDVDAKPILDVRFLATMNLVLFVESQYCAFGSLAGPRDRTNTRRAETRPVDGQGAC
jgi:hypothetical protein